MKVGKNTRTEWIDAMPVPHPFLKLAVHKARKGINKIGFYTVSEITTGRAVATAYWPTSAIEAALKKLKSYPSKAHILKQIEKCKIINKH